MSQNNKKIAQKKNKIRKNNNIITLYSRKAHLKTKKIKTMIIHIHNLYNLFHKNN